MSEWFSLLLEQLTRENLVNMGAGALLWMPLGWATFSICFCGAMLIYQYWALPRRLVKFLKVAACGIMVLGETVEWICFALIPVHLNVGMPLTLLSAFAIVILCGLSVLLFTVWFKQVQRDSEVEAST